ncbi:transcriptional regulator [Ammoniphilus resinae]|uniref:Transcriptional regulator n=1 Tax=Ammoniphilus resinae TaxID=861532 RepID=A0ABS4GXP6_9BACL|nr:transcriptional regulator [Ammoniphilus resinae]MBP1935041.1 hypothetical protein [Ammoniphilus resinae]
MFGWKPRSKFGKFLDSNGIQQERIREISKLNKDTVSKACNDNDYMPSSKTIKALLSAARKLTGKNVKSDQFWDM